LKFISGRSFRYDIKECQPHYYEVQGIGDNGYVSVTLQACDLDELCSILTAKKYNFSIKKVLKFLKPVSGGSNIDPSAVIEVKLPKGCKSKKTKTIAAVKVPVQQDPILLSYGDTSVPNRGKHFVGRIQNRSDFVFAISGTIETDGQSLIVSDNEGDVFDDVLVDDYLEGETISEMVTSITPQTPLAYLVGGKVVPCCSSPISLILECKHNLNVIPDLNRFLNLNKLSLIGVADGDYVKLTFSDRDNGWIGNLHLSGNSPIVSGRESWDLNFKFACDNNANWDFSVFVFVKRTNQRFMSRLSASFSSDVVCRNDSFGKLTFVSTHGATTLATATTIEDEAKFFRNLRLAFVITSQSTGNLKQLMEDNTAAYVATMGDT
jgi:hypothetical protein